VSDAAPSTHPAIPYSVKDCGKNHREILWGEKMPPVKLGKSKNSSAKK
jgi:hypothetical protein